MRFCYVILFLRGYFRNTETGEDNSEEKPEEVKFNNVRERSQKRCYRRTCSSDSDDDLVLDVQTILPSEPEHTVNADVVAEPPAEPIVIDDEHEIEMIELEVSFYSTHA